MDTGLCPRCGEAPEGLARRYWLCAKNAEIGELDGQEYLVEQAKKFVGEQPSVCLRGIATSDMNWHRREKEETAAAMEV